MVWRLRTNVALAPLATFGIGGRARWLASVSTSEELVRAINWALGKGWPYRLVAGGSNVVFSDKTFDGLIIHFVPKVKPCLRQGLTLTAAANAPLEYLIKTAINRGLAGLENLSGIPGTVGGAIVGNAGAYGQCISDHLIRVEVLDPGKNAKREPLNIRWLTKEQCRFAYRDSIFKRGDWLVLRAKFRLKTGDRKQLAKSAREIVKTREKKYQPGLRCPGSFFKNVLVKDVTKKSLELVPPAKIIEGKIPAGYLLEAAGAKGLRQGGIYVADFHGNLLVNGGHGTYRDVVALAVKLKRLVQKKFGIALDEEVRYL